MVTGGRFPWLYMCTLAMGVELPSNDEPPSQLLLLALQSNVAQGGLCVRC